MINKDDDVLIVTAVVVAEVKMLNRFKKVAVVVIVCCCCRRRSSSLSVSIGGRSRSCDSLRIVGDVCEIVVGVSQNGVARVTMK